MWKKGRQLATVGGATTLSFEYNADGIRTSKNASGVQHIYHLNGTQIVAEEWSNKLLIYLYDANGSPIGMQYRTTSYAEGVFDTYWFEKNLQGDIVAVYNDAGTLLATYAYDAWGGIASLRYSNGGSSTAAQYNPFRYRGYYRDSETGFYYLNSRYYDPGTGRFINMDGYLYSTLLGSNVYSYCENNPVSFFGPNGEGAIAVLRWWTSIGTAISIAEPTAIGELILIGGCIIIGGVAFIEKVVLDNPFADSVLNAEESEQKQDGESKPNKENQENGAPDITYPGDDPTVAPDGYEWKGNGPQGSKQGNYYNPNGKQSLHPDLDHPDPIGPHWDYNYKGSGHAGWRVFPDGSVIPK